ncbi:hypothetical protein [Kosakonia oryzae]|uniref:Uncharacterized protein n=1 Tax=Kosakonia oryzae TaxID=497725 RepID=A0ABN4Q4T9_9ENTR|nr:hypothetical protein [Kosakonia oryzae]ANI81295.2 hypothetical protein AWR26_03680 [Kosakonia oryzae]
MTVWLSNIFRPMPLPATEIDHNVEISEENPATSGQDPYVPERAMQPLSPFQPGRINPFVQREASAAASRSDMKPLPAAPSHADAQPRPLSPFQPGRINPFVQREASAAAARSEMKSLPAAPSRADALPRPLSPFQPGRINPFQQNDYANAQERQDSFASVLDEPGFQRENAPAYTELDGQPFTDVPPPPYSDPQGPS